jgi:Xaa-Pro aminopeptidase
MNRISDRIEALRRFMQTKGISAFIVPSTDPHSGEYVPAHWESRKWISGFTGSAGTAVITMSQGGLWTDSRYFLQAEEQLQGSGLILFKDRLPETPSIADWLGSILKPGEKVGIDGWVNSTSEALQLQKALEKYHLELVNVEDPFHLLWRDRPSLPLNPPFILPLEYSGEACNQKISRIQAILKENQVNGILISALDEIAWTLNLRGTDVHCNPVFVSYLFITSTSSTLYIQPDKLTDEVLRYDIRSKKCKLYSSQDGNINSLTQNYITDLAITQNQELVVATLKGLNFYNPATDDFVRLEKSVYTSEYLNRSSFINCLLVDGPILWIGTEISGMDKMESRNLKLRLYTNNR